MQLSAWYRIVPTFTIISSLVFNTEAYPIKPIHVDVPNPPEVKQFPSGIRRFSSSEDVDPVLLRAKKKVMKMTPAQRKKWEKELDEMVHGPKPKTRLRRLWDRILEFLVKRRRPPLDDIMDKTKKVGKASVRPLWAGVMWGGFGAFITMTVARIANLWPC